MILLKIILIPTTFLFYVVRIVASMCLSERETLGGTLQYKVREAFPAHCCSHNKLK